MAGFLATPGRNGRARLPNLSWYVSLDVVQYDCQLTASSSVSNSASVVDDDVSWSDADFGSVQTQLRLRDACFHNSSNASVPLAAAAGMDLGDGNFLNFGVGMPPVI